ncbi:MFS transporter [Desulfosporosinus sp. BICA1-9]|uniref:MFS transporter n=1 Tax=Desulfosporosinus sp. BICA1-9 TaxID=1531958 RepID=UPI00054B8E77|nr:MFS transporter [Desulfosporosinus sp. BICA1-9]KJS81366.1 MAG: MFS transporter [Desulfosporosinus sp. BICA1-9]HBW34505.1 MFS transporter [Desulfosporosinus sp.]
MQRFQEKTPVNLPFFYGWIIVVISALGLFFSGPGQTYSISVFINVYMTELGWSRSLIFSVYSLASLTAGLSLFMMGRLIDRYGQRRMSVVIGLCLGFACFWNSAMLGVVWMFIGFFMLRLFGQGSMTLIPSTLVPQWFIRQRGRAFSLMALGGFISSALVPILNVWMIQTWDLRVTWWVWGGLLIVLYTPLSYYLIRNKPEEVGLRPDGASIHRLNTLNTPEGPSTVNQTEFVDTELNWTLAEAKKTRTFWFILLAASVPALINTGLTFHLISILGERGISPLNSAFVLSLMALVGFSASFLAGFILERVKTNHALAFVFLGEIVALFSLNHVNSMVSVILFGVMWGIVGGFEHITLNLIWPNYYGRRHLGSIRAMASSVMIIGAALGPLPLGMAFDQWGGYTEILYLIMMFPFLGIIAALTSPSPNITGRSIR